MMPRRNAGGSSWVYDYDANNDHGFLSLKNYQCGSIASDIDLSVTSSGTVCGERKYQQ